MKLRYIVSVWLVLFAVTSLMSAQVSPQLLKSQSALLSNFSIGKDSTPRIPSRLISLELNDVPLEKALRQVADHFSLRLWYSEAVVPANKKVTASLKDASFAEAMEYLLASTDLEFMVSEVGQLVLTPKERVEQETGTIVGRVLEARTNKPLIGANVMIEGTGLGASADTEGNFRIERVPPGKYKLRASVVGYGKVSKDITVVAGQVTNKDFVLDETGVGLDEVVVTGTMSPTSLKAIAHPITLVTAATIERHKLRDVNDIIRFLVPSAVVMPNTGSSTFGGVGSTISFRGASASLFGGASVNGVKIFVDGIEIAQSNNAASASALFNINSDQIERLEVIRGPEAAAIYGSNALGGVINITTKRGYASNQPEVAVNAELKTIDRPYSNGMALGQYYVASLVGGGETAKYRIGANYNKVGNWIPSYLSENAGGDIGARFQGEHFFVDLTARISRVNGNAGYNPELYEIGKSTPFASTVGPSNRRNESKYQTYVVRFGVQTASRWFHTLTVGSDGYDYVMYKTLPTYYTAADTFRTYDYSRSVKNSIAYLTSVEFPLAEYVNTTVTLAGDYYSYVSNSFFTSQAVSINPLVLASGATFSGGESKEFNTGIGGEVKVGIYDALFLTGSIRAEQFAVEVSSIGQTVKSNWPATNQFGISYVHTLGDNTLKVRTSYGSAIRQSHLQFKNGQALSDVTYLPNPDLKPERQNGIDAGVDAVFGDVGSLSVSYYNQSLKDFLGVIFIQSTPLIVQYQNIALVKNKGWEFEGRLNVGGCVSIAGNFALSSSVPENLGNITPRNGLRVGEQLGTFPKQTGTLTVSAVPLSLTSLSMAVSYTGSSKGNDYPSYYRSRILYGSANSPLRNFFVDLPSVVRLNLVVERDFSRIISAYLKVDDITNQGVNEAKFTGTSSFSRSGRSIGAGIRLRY